MARIEKIDPEDMNDDTALRYVDTGAKGERTEFGEPSDISQHVGDPKRPIGIQSQPPPEDGVTVDELHAALPPEKQELLINLIGDGLRIIKENKEKEHGEDENGEE